MAARSSRADIERSHRPATRRSFCVYEGRRVAEIASLPRLPGSPPASTVQRAEIRLWDIETGKQVRDLNGPAEIGIGDVALSPDGRGMAVVDFSGLRVLDTATLELQWTADLPGWWGRRPAFSSDGRLVALGEQNAIAIFEAATGRRLHHDERTPVGRLGAAEWSPSGDRIVTGHSDGFVRVWNAATGKPLWHKLMAPVVSLGGRGADPTFAGFTGDAKLVVAAGRRDDPTKKHGGLIVSYDAALGKTVREVPRNDVPRAASALMAGWLSLRSTNGSSGSKSRPAGNAGRAPPWTDRKLTWKWPPCKASRVRPGSRRH